MVEPGIGMLVDDGETAKLTLDRNLAHPDPWARAMLNLMSAVQAENNGDVETLQYRLPLAMAGFREIGDRWGIGTTAAAMSTLDSRQGRIEEAIAHLQESRQLMIQLRAVDDECFALNRIGMLRFRLGDLEGARKDIETAVEIAERTGSAMSVAFGMFGLAVLTHHEGNTPKALVMAYQSLAQLSTAPFSPPQVKALIHCGIATLNMSADNPIGAAQRLRDAYQAVLASRDMPVAAVLATGVAEYLLARGDAAGAAEMLGSGVKLRGMEDLSDLDVRRVAGAVRAALGPEDYDRHHGSGRNLTKDAALAQIEIALKIKR